MTTYEYANISTSMSGVPGNVRDLGQQGWEVYFVDPPALGKSCTYYMRRRTDRFCEACAQAVKVMDKLAQVVP